MLDVDYCSMQSHVTNIPLRIKKELAAEFLADSEFKQIETQELIGLARVRKRIYTEDRASAICLLKGYKGLK